MSHIPLSDILNVVRVTGETGSDLPPQWTDGVEQIGRSLDDAALATLRERTLADLLDADGVAQAGADA